MYLQDYINVCIEKIKEGFAVEEIDCNVEDYNYIWDSLIKEFGGDDNIINCKCQHIFNITEKKRKELNLPWKDEIYYL